MHGVRTKVVASHPSARCPLAIRHRCNGFTGMRCASVAAHIGLDSTGARGHIIVVFFENDSCSMLFFRDFNSKITLRFAKLLFFGG